MLVVAIFYEGEAKMCDILLKLVRRNMFEAKILSGRCLKHTSHNLWTLPKLFIVLNHLDKSRNYILCFLVRCEERLVLQRRNDVRNHCVQATTISNLFQTGVDENKICAITRRDERSLDHYN